MTKQTIIRSALAPLVGGGHGSWNPSNRAGSHYEYSNEGILISIGDSGFTIRDTDGSERDFLYAESHVDPAGLRDVMMQKDPWGILQFSVSRDGHVFRVPVPKNIYSSVVPLLVRLATAG